MFKQLSALPQYLAPQRLLSEFAGWLSERRCLWFKNWQIQYLMKHYGADINEAMLSRPEDYPTFNSFFTRYLKPELRPIVDLPQAVACPADGGISQAGHIENNRLLQAKGFDYTLESLLGSNKDLAAQFQQGHFATIYLSPKDYHRVHMPIIGSLRQTIFIPGKLFSVNTKTAQTVPNLFSRNERLVCIFDTEFGPMAVILVGAMLVGSIHTVWGGRAMGQQITEQTYTPESIILRRGAEMGHFCMGSTVIILFGKDRVEWSNLVQVGSQVRVGQLFGTSSIKKS